MQRRTLLRAALLSGLPGLLHPGAALCAQAEPLPVDAVPAFCTDVLILGAGGAGLAAAALLSSIDGLTTTVLERGPFVGGTTVLCGGQWAVARTELQHRSGIEDSESLFFQDMMTVGHGRNDPDLVKAMVQASAEEYAWCRARGLEPQALAASAGMSVPRAHIIDPESLVNLLIDEATLGGVRVLASTRGTALVSDDSGRIAGVLCESRSSGRAVQVLASAKAVLLATGGFARNKTLLRRYAPGTERVLAFAGEGSMGDGLVMATALGAGLADIDNIKPSFGFVKDARGTADMTGVFYSGAVIVNDSGERYVDESLPNKETGEHSIREKASYIVFDEAMRRRQMTARPNDQTLLARTSGPNAVVFEGATINELAKKMNFPLGKLEKTIEDYNRRIREGEPDPLGRKSLSAGWGKPVPLETPPFFIMEARAGILGTNGGLTIDPQARVLHADGTVIPGLWAAGEVTGGVHGSGFMAGTGLGKALAFGRIAARSIAHALGRELPADAEASPAADAAERRADSPSANVVPTAPASSTEASARPSIWEEVL